MKQLNRKTGNVGEDYATDYLQKKGYTMLQRNYSSRFGEIDIIASKDKTLCFIEVKAKTGDEYGTPEEMITKRKIKQIHKMAHMFLLKNKTFADKFNNYRIDVIAIVLTNSQKLETIQQYEDVGSEYL